MNFWREFWSWIDMNRAVKAQRRELQMAALAPELPPADMAIGKSIMPRARRNLPAGMRKRLGKKE